MKKNLPFTILFLLCFFASTAQDAKELLKMSYDKCQSIQNGYYEMTRHHKQLSAKDTTQRSFHCHFKKLEHDSLGSSAFHNKTFYAGVLEIESMYTGEEFVSMNPKESRAVIASKSMWPDAVKSYMRNCNFYEPFTSKKSSPLPSKFDFTADERFVLKYIGVESVTGIPCHHVQIQINEKNLEKNAPGTFTVLKLEYDYWINPADGVPVQHAITYNGLMDNDTMIQYEKFVLNKYELNQLKDESVLKMGSVPATYKLEEYAPKKTQDLLAAGVDAPDWTLQSMKDEQLTLKDLKGKVVLVDFFYRACFPCLKALPVLQSLHEKYGEKGLKVIGIDPIDKKDDVMTAFLAKRNVTYTVLMDGKEAAMDYKVSGYPALYLIDKNGKVFHAHTGYDENMEESLEEMIKKLLE